MRSGVVASLPRQGSCDMARKRKKTKVGRTAGNVRPGRPEKPLERVPHSFDEIIRSLVKPVSKEKQETA